MKEGSYEHLEFVLRKVNLFFGNKTWHRNDKEGFYFKAELTAATRNDHPTLRDGGIYKSVSVTASSPEKVIEEMWKLIKSKKLLIGEYSKYTNIVEWNEEKGLLEKRKLTELEDLEVNCIY